MKIKTLIADDHPVTIKGLLLAIKMEFPEMILCSAQNAHQAIELCKKEAFDIALIDARIPGTSGIKLIGMLHEKFPSVKVIGMTAFDEPATLFEFVEAGVHAILIKATMLDHLKPCFDSVLKGERYFTADIKEILDKYTFSNARPTTNICKREFTVAKLMSEGDTTKDISKKLRLSSNTVEFYRKELMRKTKTKNATGLIGFLHRNGIL